MDYVLCFAVVVLVRGVPGIGQKTAVQLLEKHGSLKVRCVRRAHVRMTQYGLLMNVFMSFFISLTAFCLHANLCLSNAHREY